MAYFIQHRTGKNAWKLSSFARSFATTDEAWRYAATLDQDGCIPPDVRVIDNEKRPVDRPSAFAFQAELMGL